MYELIFLGYEFVAEFVPFLLVLLFFRRKYSGEPSGIPRYLLPVLLALYIIAVFHVTGAGTIYDALRTPFYGISRRINFIPFSRTIDPIGYFLNVVMLVPFGFLIPAMWPAFRQWHRTVAVSALFSLLIEVSQLLCLRGTDVDDLIMNTLGGLCGYGIFRIWYRIVGQRMQSTPFFPAEFPAYLLTLFLGRFFLFHPMGLIRLIYGV